MSTALQPRSSRLLMQAALEACLWALLLFPLPRLRAAEPAFVDGVAALVNGEAITVGEVMSAVEPMRRRLLRRYADKDFKIQMRAAYSNAVDELIDQRLILADYEKHTNKMKMDPSAVERRMAEILHDNFKDDRSALMRELSADGLTYESWRELVQRQMILSAMRYENSFKMVSVAPAAVDAFYRENLSQFRTPGKVELRVIVISRGETAETAAVRRQQANDIRRQILAGGSFEELARTNSADRSASKGGDWGWVEPELLREEFAKALADTKPGRITDVIEAGDAFYILKLEGREDEKVASLETARPDIERRLEKVESERLYRQWIGRLRAAASIRIVQAEMPFNVSP